MKKNLPNGVGDLVLGSDLYRDYCADCKEPIRVAHCKIGSPNFCCKCDSENRGVPGVENNRMNSVDNDPDAYRHSWLSGNNTDGIDD